MNGMLETSYLRANCGKGGYARPSLTCLSFFALLLLSSGCGGDRYKAVIDVAEDQLSSLTMREDHLHQLQLHEALVAKQEFSGLTFSTYVFMDRGYVIGHVDNSEQAKAVFQIARNVQGLRSLDAFLPIKRPASDDAAEHNLSEAALRAQIQAALAKTPGVVDTRVHVEVLDDKAVLLGVVSGYEEKMRAERAAAGTSGVKRVTNWLLVPESQYMAIRTQVF
jgi:hyperosmotically inducible periplasmic protein